MPAKGCRSRSRTPSSTARTPRARSFFDIKKGRLDKSNQSLELEGKLNIEIGGMTTKVELKQTQDTTVTTSDTPQVKKS